MIVGKEINLRTVRERDVDELFELFSLVEDRGDFDAFNLPSEFNLKKRIKENGMWEEDFGTLLITDKQDRLIGDITYFKGLKYADGYEIGYRLYRRADRGKGYMTEALKLFSAFLFSIKPIRRLQVNMFSENIASRRIAEKCGYTHEGTMRQTVFCRGKYYDLELFSLMREECSDLPKLLRECRMEE